MLASTIEHDERWKARYADIPRLAQSALRKFKPPGEPFQHRLASRVPGQLRPPQWLVDRVFQRGYLYALTAYWGHGKTALMLTIALCCAAGRKRRHATGGALQGDVHVRRERGRRAAAGTCGRVAAEHRLVELDGWMFFTQVAFPIEDAAAASGSSRRLPPCAVRVAGDRHRARAQRS